MKVVALLFTIILLVGCAIGTPHITRGNSSSVEVWAGHMGGAGVARLEADPIADNWCQSVGKGKDAVYLRSEAEQRHYYICTAR